jgi:hypothetical protein
MIIDGQKSLCYSIVVKNHDTVRGHTHGKRKEYTGIKG